METLVDTVDTSLRGMGLQTTNSKALGAAAITLGILYMTKYPTGQFDGNGAMKPTPWLSTKGPESIMDALYHPVIIAALVGGFVYMSM